MTDKRSNVVPITANISKDPQKIAEYYDTLSQAQIITTCPRCDSSTTQVLGRSSSWSLYSCIDCLNVFTK